MGIQPMVNEKQSNRQPTSGITSQFELIGQVAAALLRKTRERNSGRVGRTEREQLEKQARTFFEKLSTVAVDLISAGRTEDMERLILKLDDAVRAESENPRFINEAPLNLRVTARLQAFSAMLRAPLTHGEISHVLGRLSGKRRTAWRELLAALYAHGVPVRKNEVLKIAPTFHDDGTAYNALEQLTRMGLVSRMQEGRRTVLYQLTWMGRAAARAVNDMPKEEQHNHEPTHLSQDAYMEALYTVESGEEKATEWETWSRDIPGAIDSGLVVGGD